MERRYFLEVSLMYLVFWWLQLARGLPKVAHTSHLEWSKKVELLELEEL